MARIRTIKPEFFTSDDIDQLDADTALLFIGLWTYVDDNGVGRDNAKVITGQLCVLVDDLAKDTARVETGLARLAEHGLIIRYATDGRNLLYVTGWDKHQKISHPGKARFPRPRTPSSGESPEDSRDSPSVAPPVSRDGRRSSARHFTFHKEQTETLSAEQGTGKREQGAGKKEKGDQRATRAAEPAAQNAAGAAAPDAASDRAAMGLTPKSSSDEAAGPPGRADLTLGQRAREITNWYSSQVEPMCKWPAVNAVVTRALKTGRWKDDEVCAALARLSEDGRPVTVDTLRIQLTGLTPWNRPAGREAELRDLQAQWAQWAARAEAEEDSGDT